MKILTWLRRQFAAPPPGAYLDELMRAACLADRERVLADGMRARGFTEAQITTYQDLQRRHAGEERRRTE